MLYLPFFRVNFLYTTHRFTHNVFTLCVNLCVGEGCHVVNNNYDNFYNYIPKYTSLFFRWLSCESEKRVFSRLNFNLKEGYHGIPSNHPLSLRLNERLPYNRLERIRQQRTSTSVDQQENERINPIRGRPGKSGERPLRYRHTGGLKW